MIPFYLFPDTLMSNAVIDNGCPIKLLLEIS